MIFLLSATDALSSAQATAADVVWYCSALVEKFDTKPTAFKFEVKGGELYDRTLIGVAEEGKIKSYDDKTEWYFEVHDPESGNHSCVEFAVFKSLAEVRAEMKRHPGMMFRVKVPELASEAERQEFSKMNRTGF
jgi:hypothetical protein